jgi:hypothetical protein
LLAFLLAAFVAVSAVAAVICVAFSLTFHFASLGDGKIFSFFFFMLLVFVVS